MFKVERPKTPPVGLSKGYDSPDAVKELRRIFHKKCYLCETKNPMSPVFFKVVVTLCLNIKLHLLPLLLVLYLGLGSRAQLPHNFSRL